jgi:Mn-containing catalase
MSQGDGGDIDGPWNSGDKWQVISDREQQCAVDGGDGSASVDLDEEDQALVQTAAMRTMSQTKGDPMTGAELGAGDGVAPQARPH